MSCWRAGSIPVGKQHPARDGINAFFAEHEGAEGRRSEQTGESTIEHIQTAGIGAERRQDETMSVAREAAAPHRSSLAEDTRRRMEVAGNLAARGRRRWL